MLWRDAIETMRRGYAVRRCSERPELVIPSGDLGGLEVREAGSEPITLVAAWSHDDLPVLVFMGAWSRTMFVPEHEHLVARDWERVS